MTVQGSKNEYEQANRTVNRSMLFDYYGQLLSERQRQIFSLYHEDDYSLSEIATELSISRQGVHDALKKAEAALDAYEGKLTLIAKHEEYLDALTKIDRNTKELLADDSISGIAEKTERTRIVRRLNQIRKLVNDLDL
jgi:predicted DNA-binding protein YlxM (UPF0122 family)